MNIRYIDRMIREDEVRCKAYLQEHAEKKEKKIIQEHNQMRKALHHGDAAPGRGHSQNSFIHARDVVERREPCSR